jgi:hypothetical protein
VREFAIDQLGLATTLRQISFARRMNAKQWILLDALAKFRFPLSVGEWSDPDVIALFENGLVSSGMIEDGAVTTWAATDAGTNLVRLRAENSLIW